MLHLRKSYRRLRAEHRAPAWTSRGTCFVRLHAIFYFFQARGARVTLTPILGDCHASFTQLLLESAGRTLAEGTSAKGVLLT